MFGLLSYRHDGGSGGKHMDNNGIILNEAVLSGFFTQEEVDGLVSSGEYIPFHTFSTWKRMGFVPRKGSHGWETRLWRKKPAKKDDGEDDAATNEAGYYLAKSFLFHISQCDRLQEDEPCRN